MSTDLNYHGFPVTTGRAGPGWICLAEYEQDRLLIHATQQQRQILQSPSLAYTYPNVPTSTQTSTLHHWNTHIHRACHNRCEKTQRSAVSRPSLRQDSGPFTSPWLRRWSCPKLIFSTVVAQYIHFNLTTHLKGLRANRYPHSSLTCSVPFTVMSHNPLECEEGIPCGCEWHMHLSCPHLQIITPVSVMVYLSEKLPSRGTDIEYIIHRYTYIHTRMHDHTTCHRDGEVTGHTRWPSAFTVL